MFKQMIMVLMCVNNVDSIIMSIANPVNMEIIVIVIMIIIQMHQSDHFHCHRDEDEDEDDDDDARASERYCLWSALIMAFCSQNHGILQDFHVQSLWRPVPGWVYLMV